MFKLGDFEIIPIIWFIPIIGLTLTLIISISIIINNSTNKSNWFTGKHW